MIKRHLCGIHVAYEPSGGGGGISLKVPGRAQGSLYSQQKKQIADAVAYLQGKARRDCKPLVFVATSPGFIDRANEPRFISKLVSNLRNGYGMENYIWVREFTGNGFPHFHFVASIPLPKKPFVVQGTELPFNPVKLSLYWSGLFGTDAKNSIRVGSKPNKHGKRMLYLSRNRRKAWYLAKYIGKSRSDDEVRSRAKLKAFSMDEQTSAAIVPQLFSPRYRMETKALTVWNVSARKFETQYHDLPTGERYWENEKGELMTGHEIDWQRCGLHNVYTGFPVERAEESQPDNR